MEIRPVRVRREGDERLQIDWSDGVSGSVTWASLRTNCPCANCREERQKPADPFRILSERELQAGPPRPVSMSPVGYYAYKIVWNDGHDAGIYTIENLRELTSRTE
ncbi:MAG: DUF971 domain-containing protein [Gemmataceae bacterium]|nr:DUF971 domain-containing protein [Gemmataceae bacterium]